MKHLKQIIIIASLVLGITGYSQDHTTGLEQDETSQTENQREVSNQPEVQVNQEMLDRFYNYQRNGSNIFLNWSLIQGFDYRMIKAVVQDYQAITLQERKTQDHISHN